nr:MAG TPA: hypothetical protein [Caudoviricetes sp.]
MEPNWFGSLLKVVLELVIGFVKIHGKVLTLGREINKETISYGKSY